MTLQNRISPELWSAVSDSYESGNFTHSITDAMSFVTQVVRERSGLHGDGDDLVGRALGFTDTRPPIIKVNRLQTQTERDVQRGLMFTLKGLYALVRNPRTHERFNDDKDTADTLILFLDYLLNFLGRSQPSFTVEDFVDMVIDPHFVFAEEYIEHLVDKVPRLKRYDTLVATYRQASWKLIDNFASVVGALVGLLDESEKVDFLSVVSDDLVKVDKPSDVTLLLRVLPAELWIRLDRMPRMRAESMLIDEFQAAFYVPRIEQINRTAGTWVSSIAANCLLKDRLRDVTLDKLRSADFDHHNFVAKYLMLFDSLPDVFETPEQIEECAIGIADSVRAGNQYMKDSLVEYVQSSAPDFWVTRFQENLRDLTDDDDPEIHLPSGDPFLGRFQEKPNPADADEIPF
jgi:uncharacterized protein (TIGR02391 family)